MAEAGIYWQEPPRELWQSDYIEWVSPTIWHCLICDAIIHSVGGLRWCPNCEFRGFALTAQPVTISEDEVEELADDEDWIDKE